MNEMIEKTCACGNKFKTWDKNWKVCRDCVLKVVDDDFIKKTKEFAMIEVSQ